MVLTEWVRHALPLKLKDGKRHLFPTLASMVYKPDEANPDEFIPIVDENGKLVVDDAAKLAGKDASHYENIITSITANGAVVEPDEHGNVNLGNMQTGSSVELDDTLKVEGKAADAKATGDAIDQLSQQIVDNRVARSLLYNADWRTQVNIVNSNGRTGYNGNRETINGWHLWSDNGTGSVSIEDGWLAFNPGTSSGMSVSQRFKKGVLKQGKAYTMVYCDHANAIHIHHDRVHFTDAYDYVDFIVTAWIGVKWADLYEGTYTAANLPPHVSKGYANELLACEVAENGNPFEQIAAYTTTINGISVALVRYGKTVTISLTSGEASSQTVASGVFGTLPDGFKPAVRVDFKDNYAGKRLWLDLDGRMTAAGDAIAAGTILRGTITYVCA